MHGSIVIEDGAHFHRSKAPLASANAVRLRTVTPLGALTCRFGGPPQTPV